MSEIDDLKQRIAELEAERAQDQQRLFHLEPKIAELEAANAVCRRDIEALMSSCDKLEAEIAAYGHGWREDNTRVDRALKRELELERRIAELEAERDQRREELAALMRRHSFATGHGDTISDLLDELDWQLSEQKERT
jgi:chromosome segregation ATPase